MMRRLMNLGFNVLLGQILGPSNGQDGLIWNGYQLEMRNS